VKGSAKNACTLPRTMHSSASSEGNCTEERGREGEGEREKVQKMSWAFANVVVVKGKKEKGKGKAVWKRKKRMSKRGFQ